MKGEKIMTTTYSFLELKEQGKGLWELFPEFQFPRQYDTYYDIKTLADLEREYYSIPLDVAQEIQRILLDELDIRIKELDKNIARELEAVHRKECNAIMKFLATDLPRRVQDLEPEEQKRIILEWLDE